MAIKERGKEKKWKKKKDNSCKIYIFTEGNTECIYLKHFSNRKYGVEVIPVDSEHTDAVGIVRYAKEYMNDTLNDVDYSLGDRCYCVFDSDPKSNPNIAEAFSLVRSYRHKGLECIFSNPCFEVWFVLHFRNCPHGKTAKELKKLVKDLVKEKYPNYSETTDIFEYIYKKHQYAIKEARLLHNYQKEVYKDVLSHECNPYTNIFEFFDYIESVKKVSKS